MLLYFFAFFLNKLYNLKDLENSGLIIRKEYQEIPPKVEYFLSSKGKTLMPILDKLCSWGEKNRQN